MFNILMMLTRCQMHLAKAVRILREGFLYLTGILEICVISRLSFQTICSFARCFPYNVIITTSVLEQLDGISDKMNLILPQINAVGREVTLNCDFSQILKILTAYGLKLTKILIGQRQSYDGVGFIHFDGCKTG